MKKKLMPLKKVAALAISAVLVSGLTACAQKSERNTQAASSETYSVSQTLSTDDPVTIEIWHSRPAGKHYDQLLRSIDKFNSSNGKGITVKEVYQGDYVTCTAKTMQGITAGTNPILTTLTITGFTEMASNNALTDLTPYAQRDNMDMNDYEDALMKFSYYDGKLYSIPYLRSTAVFYYNKDLFAAAGYPEAPKTLSELEDACKKITAADPKKGGYGLLINDWYINTYLQQMGAHYIDEDDQGMSCLHDGSLLKFFTDWKSWIDEGWCEKPNVTNAASDMKEQFYQGNLACFLDSSANIGDITATCRDSGVNVAVAAIPHYDEGVPTAPTGGSNVVIVGANHTEREIEAAWEFIKYLVSEENQYDNAISTGYLPVTKAGASSDSIKAFYQEYPENQVAFDTISEFGHDYPFSRHLSETKTLFQNVASSLIIDGNITPEQAIEELQTEESVIFQ